MIFNLFLFPNSNARFHSNIIHFILLFSIQDQIQSVPDGVRMCTARPTWLAMSLKEATYKRDMANINVSSLDNVLMVDEENRIVHVEPNCTMGQITAELIPRGWTLAVVPELDDLTVGGLIMGFGIEVSSCQSSLYFTFALFSMYSPPPTVMVCFNIFVARLRLFYQTVNMFAPLLQKIRIFSPPFLGATERWDSWLELRLRSFLLSRLFI